MKQLPYFKCLWVVLLSSVCPSFAFPQGFPTSWSSRGVGGGGAVYSPVISPHDPDEMYLTCDMSLAHRSLDFGQHWSMIPPVTLRTGRNASVQFSASPDTLYAMHRAAQTSVHTLVRSVDGGSNWQATTSNPFGTNGVFQLYVHPGKTTTSVAANFNDAWLDGTAGTNFTSIYHSSDTKGVHLAGVFFDGDSLYVCHNKGVIYSFDNGQNWAAQDMSGIGAGEEIVAFRAAREGGTVRFVAVTLTSADVHPRVYGNTGVTHFQNIYRLDFPSQTSWTSLTAGLPTPANDRLYNVAMTSGEIDTFYVGGQAWVSGIRLGSVFRTDNGGASFQNIFLDAAAYSSNTDVAAGWKATATDPNYMHKWNGISSTEGLCVDPNDLRRLARSDLSGVHVSEDYGQTWTQAYTLPVQPNNPGSPINPANTYVSGGLETTVGYWMHFVSEDNFFAGFGDILMTHTTDGGNAWQLLYQGLFFSLLNDVSHVTKHPGGDLYAATGEVPGTNGQYNDSRLAVTPGKLAFSSDQGQTWQTKTDFGHPVLWTALHPSNSNQLFAAVADVPGGIGGIWRCDDVASCATLSDWTQLPEPPRTEGRAQEIFVLNDGTLVATYGPRDQGNFSFTASSGVFRFDAGASDWTDLTPAAMQYDLRSLSIDPNDDDVWFACVGKNGSGTKGLYRSLDRGDNWTPVQSNMTVVSATFHPDQPNSMYFCTANDGLFFATQTNAAFSATALADYPFDFPQRVFLNPFDHNEVWVQNFGNGLRVGYSSLLPLELLDFQAKCADGNVLLEWTTANEVNVAGFAVEKSEDGKIFRQAGWAAATGAARYHFSDPVEATEGETIYYRLRMADLDGTAEFSRVVSVKNCLEAAAGLVVFPNPVQGELHLKTSPAASGEAVFQLWNTSGRLVFEEKWEGEAKRVLDVKGLESGLYFYRYWSGSAWLAGRLVKQ